MLQEILLKMHGKSLVFLFLVLIGCGSSQDTEKDSKIQVNPPIPQIPLKYEVYILGSRTANNPPDEITIDSNGQMVIISQQLMPDGKWKKPKGLAVLEDKDRMALDSLVADSLLYSITDADVLPPCSNGADYIVKIARLDIKRTYSLKTNTCAADENTLSGPQRIIIRRLIRQFEAMRSKYRPQF